MKQLNYRPSASAVELASKKTKNVAIVVPEINYSYVSNVAAGLIEAANGYNYDCVIYTTKNNPKDFSKAVSKVVSLRPNGIILFNDNLSNDEICELMTFDFPLVTLGVDLKTVSSVTWHYKTQISNIVNDALDRNKDIYFIRISTGGKTQERILSAIEKDYAERNMKFENIIDVRDSYTETYNAVLEKLKTINNGFFIALRDSIALAALNACLDSNRKVPEDFEFMAMIGTKYSNLSRPKLSSFSIDMKGLGKEGMKVLAEVIDNPQEIVSKKLPFEFVKRGTTL